MKLFALFLFWSTADQSERASQSSELLQQLLWNLPMHLKGPHDYSATVLWHRTCHLYLHDILSLAIFDHSSSKKYVPQEFIQNILEGSSLEYPCSAQLGEEGGGGVKKKKEKKKWTGTIFPVFWIGKICQTIFTLKSFLQGIIQKSGKSVRRLGSLKGQHKS